MGFLDSKHKRTALVLVEQKRKRVRNYPEFTVHSLIADYCAKTFIEGRSMWQTTEVSAGGGEGSQARQARLKTLGTHAGFPDGIVLYDGKIILVEIKAAKGVLSPIQIEMHKKLHMMGFVVEVVYSLDEFRAMIKRHKVPTRDVSDV